MPKSGGFRVSPDSLLTAAQRTWRAAEELAVATEKRGPGFSAGQDLKKDNGELVVSDRPHGLLGQFHLNHAEIEEA
jgi:hypothetical protein